MEIEGKKAAYLRRGEGRTIGTYRSNIASAAESGSDLKEVIKRRVKRKEEVLSPRILQSPVLKKDASAPICPIDNLKQRKSMKSRQEVVRSQLTEQKEQKKKA